LPFALAVLFSHLKFQLPGQAGAGRPLCRRPRGVQFYGADKLWVLLEQVAIELSDDDDNGGGDDDETPPSQPPSIPSSSQA